MLRRGCIAVVLSAVAVCGSVVRADDMADIRTSGKAFGKALVDGDAVSAKRYSVTDSTSEKALDLMCEMAKSRNALINAAVAKFGDEGKNVTLGGPNESRQEAFRTDFEDAKIDVKGNTATVTSKDGADSKPVYFKKMGGVWKLDLANIANFGSVTQKAAQIHLISNAYSSTATEIRDGKYKTVLDAKTAVREKVVSAAGRRGRGG